MRALQGFVLLEAQRWFPDAGPRHGAGSRTVLMDMSCPRAQVSEQLSWSPITGPWEDPAEPGGWTEEALLAKGSWAGFCLETSPFLWQDLEQMFG